MAIEALDDNGHPVRNAPGELSCLKPFPSMPVGFWNDPDDAQLLRDFLRDFVRQQQEATEHDTRFRRQVQVGLDSANAGRLVRAEQVEAEFAARRAKTRRELDARS